MVNIGLCSIALDSEKISSLSTGGFLSETLLLAVHPRETEETTASCVSETGSTQTISARAIIGRACVQHTCGVDSREESPLLCGGVVIGSQAEPVAIERFIAVLLVKPVPGTVDSKLWIILMDAHPAEGF